jgi:hypothetical protein
MVLRVNWLLLIYAAPLEISNAGTGLLTLLKINSPNSSGHRIVLQASDRSGEIRNAMGGNGLSVAGNNFEIIGNDSSYLKFFNNNGTTLYGYINADSATTKVLTNSSLSWRTWILVLTPRYCVTLRHCLHKP